MSTFIIRSFYGLVSVLNVDDDVCAQFPALSNGPDNGLNPHSQLHTSALLKRQCPDCARIFSTAGHLHRHALIHTGVKDYCCPFPECIKSCARADNLIQHYRIHLPPYESHSSHSVVRNLLIANRAEVHARLAEEEGRASGMSPGDLGPGSRSPSPDSESRLVQKQAELQWSPLPERAVRRTRAFDGATKGHTAPTNSQRSDEWRAFYGMPSPALTERDEPMSEPRSPMETKPRTVTRKQKATRASTTR